jgi:hypothetical protein
MVGIASASNDSTGLVTKVLVFVVVVMSFMVDWAIIVGGSDPKY